MTVNRYHRLEYFMEHWCRTSESGSLTSVSRGSPRKSARIGGGAFLDQEAGFASKLVSWPVVCSNSTVFPEPCHMVSQAATRICASQGTVDKGNNGSIRE